jgi:hypothetical protein
MQQGRRNPHMLTIEKVITLASVSMFAEVPDELLVDVASVLEEVAVSAGEAIVHQGDVGTSTYIIGVWRILCIAQIEHKRISAYARSATPKHTPERISSCSNSLYSIHPSC